MSRADYHLRHTVMGMIGTFWSRSVTDQTKREARALVSLAANASGLQQLETPMRKLISARRVAVENVPVCFVDGEFVYIGPDTMDAWRSEALVDGETFRVVRFDPASTAPVRALLLTTNGRLLVAGGLALTSQPDSAGYRDAEALFVVPVPAGLTPVTIAGRDTILINGIDFESGPGYIVMRDSPADTFAIGGFTVLQGFLDLPTPYNFTMQLNGAPYGHQFVAVYYRGASSAGSFERAAAQAAGLLVLEQDDTLIHKCPLSPDVTRYVFAAAGPIDVAYPHHALDELVEYPRGYIVSNGFKVATATGGGWLRNAAAGATLSLDGVLPVKGLALHDGKVYADFLEITGGKPHVRLHFAGNASARIALWAAQKAHELLTGVYLSDSLGITPTSPSRMLDFHTLLENFYGARLLLLLPGMEGAPVGFLDRLLEFATRESPLNSVLLIATAPQAAPTIPGPQLLSYGDLLWSLDGSIISYSGE